MRSRVVLYDLFKDPTSSMVTHDSMYRFATSMARALAAPPWETELSKYSHLPSEQQCADAVSYLFVQVAGGVGACLSDTDWCRIFSTVVAPQGLNLNAPWRVICDAFGLIPYLRAELIDKSALAPIDYPLRYVSCGLQARTRRPCCAYRGTG